MANRYWVGVGASTSWNSTANTNWSTSSGVSNVGGGSNTNWNASPTTNWANSSGDTFSVF